MSFSQLARLIDGKLYGKSGVESTFNGVSIDSRTLKPGEVFFALKGENHDGHDYILQALQKGASGVVVESVYPQIEMISERTMVVTVKNSHEAMLALAVYYRHTVAARYFVITGSNGKTTTKELLYYLLRVFEAEVYRSPGNLNNLYGLPLSLFAMPHTTRVAVLELGISIPGEMTRLARIVRPDLIIITNVGPTHLETLGSVAGVARAKLELVKEAAPDTPVIINGDNEVLCRETKKIKKDFVTFGLEGKVDFKPQKIKQLDRGFQVTVDNRSFELPFFGRYQIYNFLAAYAAVRTVGYNFNNVDTRPISFQTAPLRGQFINIHGVTFISDCYNANPESVKAGLSSFAEQSSEKRRLIILGDMLELGREEERWHRETGQLLALQKFDLVALVGPLSKFIMEELVKANLDLDKIWYFTDARSCAEKMVKNFRSGDLVYIKGSRGIGLELIMDTWREKGRNT